MIMTWNKGYQDEEDEVPVTGLSAPTIRSGQDHPETGFLYVVCMLPACLLHAGF
jgi:hypothetical protein